MPLNVTFTWCMQGYWILPLQLQVLVLCFCGLSEAVGNINLVCISLFKAFKMPLLPYIQEWVCAENCSWARGCPALGTVSVHKGFLTHYTWNLFFIQVHVCKFIQNISCPQGEGSFQLRLGGVKHCRAHFVCTSFEILIKTQNSSLLDLAVPRMWWSWKPTLGFTDSPNVPHPCCRDVLVLSAQTWLLFPAVAPCPCPGWAWGASWFHSLCDFQASLPENRTRVLIAGVFGCDTSKEGISAGEEISSEDLRMRKSNYHSAAA